MSIRDRITEIIKEKLCPIPTSKQDPEHSFYFKNYKDNLFCEMSDQHKEEYGGGSGGELTAKGNRPAKMASIASSSAMTFNILGNHAAVIKAGYDFAPGRYAIKYEQQMYTLNKSSNPANLDAFLYNDDAQEAIFCEMKMLEWLGKPGKLKAAYLNANNYYDEKAFDVFSKIAATLKYAKDIESKDEYSSIFVQYDAWQMFKHTLAIYNAVSTRTKAEIDSKHTGGSMAVRFKSITLVNVVFELDESLIEDERLREKYASALQGEKCEAARFIEIMMDPIYGLEQLFRDYCGVCFEIKYVPVYDFANMLEKTDAERNALARYCCQH